MRFAGNWSTKLSALLVVRTGKIESRHTSNAPVNEVIAVIETPVGKICGVVAVKRCVVL